LKINRTETEAKINPEELIKTLSDFNKRKEFDENFVEVRSYFNSREKS